MSPQSSPYSDKNNFMFEFSKYTRFSKRHKYNSKNSSISKIERLRFFAIYFRMYSLDLYKYSFFFHANPIWQYLAVILPASSHGNYTAASKGRILLYLFFSLATQLLLSCDLAATFLRLSCDFPASFLRLSCDLLLSCDFPATFLRLSCDFPATFLLLSFDLLLSCDLAATSLQLSCDFSATFLRLSCDFPATKLRLAAFLRRKRVAAKSQESVWSCSSVPLHFTYSFIVSFLRCSRRHGSCNDTSYAVTQVTRASHSDRSHVLAKG